MVSMSNEENNSVSFAYNNISREIYLTGEITDDLYQNLVAALRELDSKKGKITIILNSGGGSINAAFAMYDLIRLAKNKVVCYCTGNCMSAAMLVLCSCNERYSTENCRFMLHPAALPDTGGSLPFLKVTVSEIENSNEKAIDILTKHSNLTLKEVKGLCKEITYMSAEQVCGYGWIDKILLPNRRR